MVKANAAVWEIPPLAPVRVTLKAPVAAEDPALKVKVTVAPAATLTDGAVTPFGRPLAVTATVPVKPFMAVTET